jgi:hypothetical protein
MVYVSVHRLGRTVPPPDSVPVTIAVSDDCLVAAWDDGRHDEFVLGELFGDVSG